jgi:chromosome segregation ATPase
VHRWNWVEANQAERGLRWHMKGLQTAKVEACRREDLALGGGNEMDPQIAVLETKIGHIQTDISEIKQEQRRMADRLDTISSKFDDRLDALGSKFDDRFDALSSTFDDRFDKVNDKIDRIASDVNKRVDGTREEISTLRTSVETVKTSVERVKASIESTKVWMLTTLFSCVAVLLAVMAHGFKWI